MKRLKLFRWAAVLTLAIVLAPGPACAQEPDTLSYVGTFHMHATTGSPGDDLAEVYANGHDHNLTLTMSELTYSYDSDFDEGYDEHGYYYYWSWQVTRIQAASFAFGFSGPNADVLNQVVSQQFESAVIEQWVWEFVDGRDPLGPGSSSEFYLRLLPPDSSTGITFEFYVSQPYGIGRSSIIDRRSGNWGELLSDGNDNLTFIPTNPPPPPPPSPTLSIADGSVREGNKGTTRLNLTVTLSRSISAVVTVTYATANGTAQKKSDYTAANGTLTIQPGQTQGTISIAIKPDRKREPNETFSVQLSNAVGATISDGLATATILNDD